MANTGWRVALGTVASAAFFWGVAGAVDLGLERTRKGYTLPDGGVWFSLALIGGFIVAYFSLADLSDRVEGWKAALIPTTGAGVGAVACLLMGQQTRHWVAASLLVLVGSALPLIVHLRDPARRARRPDADPAP